MVESDGRWLSEKLRQELSENTKSFYKESFNIGMFDYHPLKKNR